MTKRLTPEEQNAVNFLGRHGPYCPGLDLGGLHENVRAELRRVLDGVVKKKRATIEPTDDGPRYHLTPLGQEEVDHG